MNRREFLFGAAAAAGAMSAFAVGTDAKAAPAKTRLRIAHLTDPQFGFGPGKSPDQKYANDVARFEREIEIVNDMNCGKKTKDEAVREIKQLVEDIKNETLDETKDEFVTPLDADALQRLLEIAADNLVQRTGK